MNFFIKKNSTLPKLKFELINDGRSDYLLNTALSNSDTFYLSLWDIEKKIYKTIKKECTITSEVNEEGLLSYFINYQFSLSETKESKTFEVQISHIDERGTEIFPIKEKIYCMVLDGFGGENQTNNTKYKLNISCCSSNVDFPSLTPTRTQTPTPSITPTITPTPSITPTNTQTNTPTPSITLPAQSGEIPNTPNPNGDLLLVTDIQRIYNTGSILATYNFYFSRITDTPFTISFTDNLPTNTGSTITSSVSVTVPVDVTSATTTTTINDSIYSLSQTSYLTNFSILATGSTIYTYYWSVNGFPPIFNVVTQTPTPTPTNTPTRTPTPTNTPTRTLTPTNTPTSIPANTLNYLYVSPFIDRNDGVLADIELVNPGSGYTTPFVSATTIVGGSGTSGRIILNVDTGTTRAVGTFIYNRGNNYSNPISVTFPTPLGGTAAQVNVYANQKQAILGYPVYENQLLQLCSNNGINALIFYDLNFMDWATNSSGTTSAPGKTMLKNFIEKARLSGITHISAARGWDTTGNSQTQINQIRDYHSWATTSGFTNGYFDSITTEIEWWATSDRTVFDSVVYGLNYAKSTLTSPSVQVNVYLGKGNYYYGTDPAMLSTKVDKWFVSTYMSTSRANTIGELYTDTRGNSSGLYRMKNIATAYTSTSKTKVLPIYSVESKLDQWNRNGGFNGTNYNTIDPNSSEDFMGTYFTGNTVSTSWNSWVGNQSYPTNSSFYTENDSDIRNNINVEGVVLFFSKLFDISR